MRPHGLTTGGRETERKLPPMARVRDPQPRLHPQIKREIAEAWLTRWFEALGAAGLHKFPPGSASWLAENDPDSVLRDKFGGLPEGRSYWDRLEAHLAKVYAGKTTIASTDARRAPRLPIPAGWVPWAKIGGPRDYPDPRFCSEIEGLLEFGIYWPLWKLGIPLDFTYPAGWADRTESEVVDYERRKIKPLLKKARRRAALLERTAVELVEAEKANPRYRTWGSDSPRLESSHVQAFDGVRAAAHYAGALIPRLPRQKRGPKKAYSKDDLVKRLKALDLSDAAVAEALKLLGLEGAGDARERIRLRRRRLAT